MMQAPASIDELEHILETFYEDDIEKKVVAARKGLDLLLDVNHLEELLNHGTERLVLRFPKL